MDPETIKSAIAEVTAELDPTVKSLKMASLVSALWAEQGFELVVVGGSAIEIFTEGAYTSGDLDLCYTNTSAPPLRQRQEIMGLLGAKGGPRSWQVGGMFVDVLGFVESLAQTPYRRVRGPYGDVLLMKPEDLLVERVLVSFYPEPNPAAQKCARSLAVVMLVGAVNTDWSEIRRIANRPEYRNLEQCKTLVREVADELKVKSPLDSN